MLIGHTEEFLMSLRDQYRIQAQDRTNRAWAYPKNSPQGVSERDQAKWEYAVEECAGRLRADAALRSMAEALDEMLGALRQANKFLSPDPTPSGSIQ
jgi:hypothetical protein